eukprot:TRINITY_DN74916_c0_g1_i1.p1 TRINITY_DN74916_c0_g1~~TRINITY_DN74916_c0_g1_i1.p1  ORF type:complete len:468 (-),score=131.91 TRINITY_DN74916_c0_g1_i1:122-1525(-)
MAKAEAEANARAKAQAEAKAREEAQARAVEEQKAKEAARKRAEEEAEVRRKALEAEEEEARRKAEEAAAAAAALAEAAKVEEERAGRKLKLAQMPEKSVNFAFKKKQPPVKKTEVDGKLIWEVVLKKREDMPKFGFSHLSGKVAFHTERYRKLTAAKDGEERPASPTSPKSPIDPKVVASSLRRNLSEASASSSAAQVGSVKSERGMSDGAASSSSKAPSVAFTLPGVPQESRSERASLPDTKERGATSGDTNEEQIGPEELRFKKIAGGSLLDEWLHQHPDAQIRMTDRVSAVNGKRTIQEMKSELSTAETIVLEIVRYPDYIEITMDKRPEKSKLGFRFEKPTNSSAEEVKITEVAKDGLLDEANQKLVSEGLWHKVVMPGMRIERVNEVSGDAAKIAEALRKCPMGPVVLHLRRAEGAARTQETMQRAVGKIKLAGLAKKGTGGLAALIAAASTEALTASGDQS